MLPRSTIWAVTLTLQPPPKSPTQYDDPKIGALWFSISHLLQGHNPEISSQCLTFCFSCHTIREFHGLNLGKGDLLTPFLQNILQVPPPLSLSQSIWPSHSSVAWSVHPFACGVTKQRSILPNALLQDLTLCYLLICWPISHDCPKYTVQNSFKI